MCVIMVYMCNPHGARESEGLLARKLQDLLNAKNLSITNLSESLGISYEHVRKIVKGETTPSRHVVRELSLILDVDEDDLSDLANKDRALRKFGVVGMEAAAWVEDVAPIGMVWKDLSEAHRDDLLLLARRWANQDREKKALSGGGTGTGL
jgi:transcriptional regulator with XRE-family HTH domain